MTEKQVIEQESNEDNAPVFKNEPEKETELPEPTHFYYVATVKIVYVRDDKAKERTVNVMLDLNSPAITNQIIHDITTSAAQRVVAEGNVPQEDVREGLIMGISFLGAMTESTFRGNHNETVVEHNKTE